MQGASLLYGCYMVSMHLAGWYGLNAMTSICGARRACLGMCCAGFVHGLAHRNVRIGGVIAWVFVCYSRSNAELNQNPQRIHILTSKCKSGVWSADKL